MKMFHRKPVQIKLNKNTHKRKLEKLKLRHNKHVNIFIGEKLTKEVERLFFCKEPNVDDGSITVHYKGDPWLSGVFRDIGIFSSTSEAKGAGWHKKADYGFYHKIIIIDRKPHNICIFKEDLRSDRDKLLPPEPSPSLEKEPSEIIG